MRPSISPDWRACALTNAAAAAAAAVVHVRCVVRRTARSEPSSALASDTHPTDRLPKWAWERASDCAVLCAL
jgi:hypothetical protein